MSFKLITNLIHLLQILYNLIQIKCDKGD